MTLNNSYKQTTFHIGDFNMEEITLYFTEVNNVTTKFFGNLPSNLDFLLLYIRGILKEYPQYLYCRFYFMGSYYQVNNNKYVQL